MHLRFYLKVLAPNPVFLFKRYDKAYRRKLPRFYAGLAIGQYIVLVFAMFQFIKYPFNYEANKTYFENHYQVMSGKLVQAGCYKQNHHKKCSVFVLGRKHEKFYARFDRLPKDILSIHELRHHLQQNVVVEYIKLPKAKDPLLLSLEVSPDDDFIAPRKSLLSFDQAIAGYSRTTSGIYAMYLIFYLLISWRKYQRYGLRDYYRAIETLQSQPEEYRLNQNEMWLRCTKTERESATPPSKEMLKDARRVASLVKETLSQEEINNCEQTRNFLNRHHDIYLKKISKKPWRNFNRRIVKPIKSSRLFALMAAVTILFFYLLNALSI